MTALSAPATDVRDPVPAVGDGDSSRVDCGLTVHAVLPPPVTGMTLCTESIARAVGQHVPVQRFNLSTGAAQIDWSFRFGKALRALSSPWRLIFSPRREHAVFYMPSNLHEAVYFNVLSMATARLRGYRCVLHHHHFGFVDRYNWKIALLTRIVGPRGLQIVLCPEMERQFRARYGEDLPLAVMPSTVQLLDSQIAPPRPQQTVTRRDDRFRLGFIGAVQVAKGIDLVLAVLRALRARGRDVVLVVAGRIKSDVEKRMLEEAQHEFGPQLDYRGPVYGGQKQRFFEDIDVKLLPTRCDAQPLVISEAFAFAKPVIAYGRGCIPGMLAADWAVPVECGFVDEAVQQIERWIEQPDEYAAASGLARERYETLMREAEKSLQSFVRWIRGEPCDGFVRRSGNVVGGES